MLCTYSIYLRINQYPLFALSLNGKLKCTSMENSLIIYIKEIRVQGRLQYPSHYRNQLRALPVAPAVYPVQQVKGTVEAEAEEVVRGDGFGFTSFL